MHYEGEERRENRFSSLFSNNLENGGIELEKEANLDKTFKKGRKYVSDFCYLLKLSQNISDIATARLLTMLKINNQKKDHTEEDEENGKKK